MTNLPKLAAQLLKQLLTKYLNVQYQNTFPIIKFDSTQEVLDKDIPLNSEEVNVFLKDDI